MGIPKFFSFISERFPAARVAVYVKAGSRFEPNALPGITHFLKASAGLTTEKSSIFGIARHFERVGAKFNVTTDREYVIYRVDCLSDKLDFCLGFVDDTLHKPEFRPWELVDTVQPRLKEELNRYKANQKLVANEALHKAAYRGGLAHSLYIPEHQIEKIKNKHLFEHVRKNVVPDRISFIGFGVKQEDLIQIVQEKFKFNNANYQGVDGKTRYVGGEARMQAGFDKTLVNFVVEGAPISDIKKVAFLEVLVTLLGGYDQQYVKYGIGTNKSLSCLMETQIKPNAITTSIININYSDTGLFGFSLHGQNEPLSKALNAAVKIFKHNLSEIKSFEDKLEALKNTTKARILLLSENQELSFNAMGHRFAGGVTDSDALKAIDSLTIKDLTTGAASLLKSKPTLVSVGNPRFVPYLDEINW